MLLAEQSYCQLHFYKYEEAETSVKEGMSILGLKMDLTGRLGKRTKY